MTNSMWFTPVHTAGAGVIVWFKQIIIILVNFQHHEIIKSKFLYFVVARVKRLKKISFLLLMSCSSLRQRPKSVHWTTSHTFILPFSAIRALEMCLVASGTAITLPTIPKTNLLWNLTFCASENSSYLIWASSVCGAPPTGVGFISFIALTMGSLK